MGDPRVPAKATELIEAAINAAYELGAETAERRSPRTNAVELQAATERALRTYVMDLVQQAKSNLGDPIQ